MAGKLKTLSVSLQNRPGALAEVARALASEDVNIEAMEAEILGKHGFFRFYSEDQEKAEGVLRRLGYIVMQTDTVEVVLGNKPGALARVCEILAEGGVNIESCFGSSWGKAGQIRIFLRVSDPAKAHRLLKEAAVKSTVLAHAPKPVPGQALNRPSR